MQAITNYGKVREAVLSVLSDGKKHETREIREYLETAGVNLSANPNIISNSLYKLKNAGLIEACGEKGFYRISNGSELHKIPSKKRPDTKHKAKTEDLSDRKGETASKPSYSVEKTLKTAMNIDMTQFIVIKPQGPRRPEFRVSILEAGEIKINSVLFRRLGTREIEILLSKDLRTLILNPCGDQNMIFTKAGTAKNREIVDILKKLKLPFPIIYNINWNEEYGAWTGILNISPPK